jgi:hypothetical protein
VFSQSSEELGTREWTLTVPGCGLIPSFSTHFNKTDHENAVSEFE